MKKLLNWFRGSPVAPPPAAPQALAPLSVDVQGVPPFRITDVLHRENGFPVVDWDAVLTWIDGIEDETSKAQAWAACERAWLLHLRDALGNGYRLDDSKEAALVSSLSPKESNTALQFIDRSRTRILNAMEGVAQTPEWGKDILIVLDGVDTYYDYVSIYGPESGDFALSSGMHISRGCSHFVTRKEELRAIEPTIVHEMTHSLVAHLPLPLWLNEGMAVNMEESLTVSTLTSLYTPAEMHQKHRAFWGPAEIQEFWQGKSFQRQDDGNMLSYDLAQILVEHFAKQWAPCKAFAVAAHFSDGGYEAARQYLGVDLGVAAASLFEQPGESIPDWTPRPEQWDAPPEHLEKDAFHNARPFLPEVT